MFKKKSESYWLEFAGYQSYPSTEQLFQSCSSLVREYDLPESAEAVLNTLKLHSQTFFGVCWLKVSEIAKKASLSARTVQRVLKSLKDNGIISIHPQLHTKRGGSAPNVYVINSLVDIVDNVGSCVPHVVPQVMPNDVPLESVNPLPHKEETPVSPAHSNPYSSFNTSPNNSINNVIRIPDDLDTQGYDAELKMIPQEFKDIMNPYYSGNPEVIAKRWKTTLLACKRGAIDIQYVCWSTIKDAWVMTVKAYKARKIKNDTDHGLGGYYFSILSDLASADYIDYLRENVWK